MKVIHAANFSLFPPNLSDNQQYALHYSQDRFISNGLIRNGHCVFEFPINDTLQHYRNTLPFWQKKQKQHHTNKLLIDAVTRLKPDWLVLGHAKAITPETLETIRQQFPNIKICQWWVDLIHSDNPRRIASIKGKLPYVDAMFCTTSPAYLSGLFKDAGNIHFMPNICDSSVCSGRAFQSETHQHDIAFIGRPNTARQELVDLLRNNFSNYKLGIYGDTPDNELGSDDYIRTLSHSKIVINYGFYNNIPLYSSDRIAHITGNGALALSAKIPHYEALYTEDEVAYFNDLPELKSKIQYYLERDSERQEIAKRGWQRAHADYNERAITKYFEEVTFGTAHHPWLEL